MHEACEDSGSYRIGYQGKDYYRRIRHITAKSFTLLQWEREGLLYQASEALLDAVFVSASMMSVLSYTLRSPAQIQGIYPNPQERKNIRYE